ncbi:MAG TPA: ATP-binding cassette domain-containing protein [Syntrophorhabdales bacterium]|nr:ATP-binding cassette domain-containing protein [Syntrophorhabdales bacterium]
MLTVSNLTKSYAEHVIFDNVTFTVSSQERVGLVGRNGSGKTTLFRLLLGEEQCDSGAITTPKYYTLGHLSQHVDFSRETVLEEACRDLKQEDDGRDTSYKVKAILLGLGFLETDFGRNPLELSGGFQIRLNLARVLAGQPNLLLLDEPTNYLDIVSVRWLTRFLREWKNELILITHDRAFMDSVTTHTMGIHRRKIRKVSGSTGKLYEQIVLEEEIHEKTRVHEERKRKELEEFINRFRAQATRARAVQSRIRSLQKKEKLQKLDKPRNLDFEFPHAPFHGKWVLEAHEISFSFSEESPLISELSMAVGRKDRIGIIGKNGKGKTTLLNLLAGELKPMHGFVTFHENLKSAYFGQTNIDRLDPDNTVQEEVLSVNGELSPNTIRNICGAMLFEGSAALKKVGVLSGGEKSRVLLAKLLVTPVNLLLLDEPTNHLDMESIDSLIDAMDAFSGAVLIATHSEMVLHAVATRLVVFDGDRPWLFEGTYQDFLDRVGWKDEETAPNETSRIPEIQRKKSERRDLRRIRAEIIGNRSRALTPLQSRVRELESQIIALEEQVKEDNATLLRASQQGSGRSIAALSISIHESRKKIEALFEELEQASLELHLKSKEFETMFKELEQKT